MFMFRKKVTQVSTSAGLQKEAKKFQEELQKGDKIVTIAGIHGIVNKVNDDNTLQIEVNPGSFIKIEKSAISMEWSEQINKTAASAK